MNPGERLQAPGYNNVLNNIFCISVVLNNPYIIFISKNQNILDFSYLPMRGSKTKVHIYVYATIGSKQTSLKLVTLMK